MGMTTAVRRMGSIGLLATLLTMGLPQIAPASAGYECGKLFTFPADDAPNEATGGGGENLDNLDVIAGGVDAESDTTLTVSVGVKDLSMALPDNGTSANWYFHWTFKEVNYFGRATVTLATPDAPAYTFGTYDATTSRYTAIGPTTGTFNEGPGGTVAVEIPLESVGAPVAGDKFTQTFGTTYVGQGVPGGPTTLAQVDRGPKAEEAFGTDYVLGSCSSESEPPGDLASPGVGLRFATLTPRKGTTVKATASLKECEGHAGTDITLERKKSGVFTAVATKPLNDVCKAVFKVRARFRKATFRALWPQQDEDHAAGTSRSRTVTPRRG